MLTLYRSKTANMYGEYLYYIVQASTMHAVRCTSSGNVAGTMTVTLAYLREFCEEVGVLA